MRSPHRRSGPAPGSTSTSTSGPNATLTGTAAVSIAAGAASAAADSAAIRGGHRGHRAGRGDVRAAVLALLDEEPMHGYQMIQELGERSGGAWTPSPGSIYPALQLLQDEGLVTAAETDGKRVFSLTEAGREQAAKRGDGPLPGKPRRAARATASASSAPRSCRSAPPSTRSAQPPASQQIDEGGRRSSRRPDASSTGSSPRTTSSTT